MKYEVLRTRIGKNPTLDFGAIFSEAIELFKKVWAQGLLLLFISMLVGGAVAVIFYIPMMLGFVVLDSNFGLERNPEMSVLLILVMILLYVILIIVASIFSFGLQAAFFRQIRLRERGLDTENGWSWGMFFRKEYLKKTSLLALATVGISIGAMLLCVLPLYYVMIPLQFVAIIYAFNSELTIHEIISASFDLGTKKWLITFGLTIVASFLAQIVGMLMCFVGIFFTASFVYLPAYLIYKNVVGFNEVDDSLEAIGNMNPSIE